MRNRILLCGLALALPCASAALAAGYNTAWDECIIDPSSLESKTFACDTNEGMDLIFVSFFPPAGIGQFAAIEQEFAVYTDTYSALDPWWQLKGAGQCRDGAISMTGDFSAASNACDPGAWATAVVGGIASYNVSPYGYADFNGVIAVPSAYESALTEGVEYYGFKIGIAHTKTVGLEACSGCAQGVCIRCASIRLVQPLGAPGGNVTIADNPSGSDLPNQGTRSWVVWNPEPWGKCFGTVPARRATWGAVKSLYR